MRLKRLYTNQPELFSPIVFNDGLSAILAEIRIPANRTLDTHNLGKTTVGSLIDYCLLRSKAKDFFLFRHEALFQRFTFYLEVEISGGKFLTISRPVDPGSRVDLVLTDESVPDVTQLDDLNWSHTNLAFSRAKLLLDGMLGIEALKPWGFRKLVGYLIRSQRDYMDVFQLGKFSGKHQDWKPFVAHVLGMDAQPVIDLYGKREELAATEAHLAALTREWGGESASASVLDGLISVMRRDVEAKSDSLDTFSFREEDSRKTTDLVEQTELRISALNEESYRLSQLAVRLDESLAESQVIFRTEDAERLFREAGISFGDQVVRDYRQLVEFNRAITEERRQVLEAQRVEVSTRLGEIDRELIEFNLERTRSLEFLREADSLQKYKELSQELVSQRAELKSLEVRRAAVERLLELRREERAIKEQYGHLETEVEALIGALSSDEESRFGQLRRYFTEIVHEVLGQNAVLAIKMNSRGGLEFAAEFIGDGGTATSGDQGTSYKKLLCIAFDLAMLRTYLDVEFPRFVYHDGAFEQLEPRKREKLLGVFREYADLGIQPIVSLLDSDLPASLGTSASTLTREEVVLTLHDEGDDGRLFRMSAW
ncbi:DUF2326 domain-containing protein [Promicromonospora sp. NPDC023805]|uniref:DUF2326 domain-containing protein n=1 Tax=Promicromonospora sp. NPDC023805 TaxID=3154696 RepID=UPI0033C0EC4D